MNNTKTKFSNINNFIDENRKNLFKASSNKILDLTGEKFSEKLENVVSKDGVLRIGIVGQVKAGKSSFINALLFDGKDILPKASTPMTAALTVIKYSKTISAEVEFYSEADWNIIERKAQEYEESYRKVEQEFKNNIDSFSDIRKEDIELETKNRVGDAIASSYEVYMIVKHSGLDIQAHIGKTQDISEGISSIDELVGKLQNYVGVHGKYTAITRNTNLYLDIPTLKGIELIDTPGTNDPIVSRGQTTRDFLSQCDTVFLLSYSGQFMGKEDAEFLVNTLPAEGISNIMLLGSKFDSVLLDEFKKYNGDIKTALRTLHSKLSDQATDSLDKIISNNPNKPIMQKIRSKKVKFISGICYNIAKKEKRNLDEIEEHILKSLEKRYKLNFSNEILFQLANIDIIRDSDLEDIKKDKEEILSNKLNDFIVGQKDEVKKELNILTLDVEQRIEELNSSNINELTQQQQTLEEGFNQAEEGIQQVFIDFKLDVRGNIYALIAELDSERSNYSRISKNRESREKYSHSTRGGFLWLTKTDHYKTEYYDIANVNEAVDKAVKFIREANSSIQNSWNKMINIESMESQLIKEASSGFQLDDTRFNKNKIINPVKNALREIAIKPYQLRDKKYIDDITSHFSSHTVEGSDIYKLESSLSNILYNIVEEIESTLEDKIEEISTLLDEKSDTFVSSIKEDSNKTINKLKQDLENLEASKQRDTTLLTEIKNLKEGL